METSEIHDLETIISDRHDWGITDDHVTDFSGRDRLELLMTERNDLFWRVLFLKR